MSQPGKKAFAQLRKPPQGALPLARSFNEGYVKQRRAGFPWLRFWPELEREYRGVHLHAHALRIRLSSTLGVCAVAGFVALDHFIGLGLLRPDTIGILLMVTVPAMLLPALATAYTANTRHLQSLVYVATLVNGASLGCVGYLGSAANPWFPYEALLLVTTYIYFLSGLLFYQAISCGVLVALIYLFGLSWLAHQPDRIEYHAYFLGISNLIGAVGLYLQEREGRLSFLLERELRQQAVLDSLTGVMNRRAFRAHLNTVWRQAQRDGANVGLLLMDIDHFKSINDRHGHGLGDTALRRVAQLLRANAARPLDAVGRYGGDEFVGVWYGVDLHWFTALTQQLPSMVGGIALEGRNPVQLSISGGAVLAQPQSGLSVREAFRIADEKLYEAKRGGRSAVLIAASQAAAPLRNQNVA